MLKNSLLYFLKLESATGILLVVAMMFAMALANSPLNVGYETFISTPVVVSFGEFMIGLEVKREVIEGSLSNPKAVAVPAIAALGGMAVPALIFAWFNWNDPVALGGWAIPSATDIAFALGILTLLGNRVPAGLKLFLLALAIIDDLGAIVIIALFYTSELSTLSLVVAASMIAVLLTMNRRGVVNNAAYVLVGIVLWTAVLKSGVHATLAGVTLGLILPLKNNRRSFHHLEHSLHAPVNFVILPLFAFVNTGISFGAITSKDFVDNVTLGIAFGLFFGKQIGVFLFSALAIKGGLGHMPRGVSWMQLYGVSILSGIGFTMSLFIGSLAFESARGNGMELADERLGVLLGSLASAVIGYFVLKATLKKEATNE